MENSQTGQYILGIDLGTNSLGWAVIGLIDGEPASLVRCGVRVFEAGMDESKGLGREESRNKARRDARLQRRQTWRRARRLKKVFNLLRRFGLLPEGDARTPEARQDLLNELDRRILASAWFAEKRASGRYPEPDQTMPYILRAAALDEPLEPRFLGRALYHLAQRRGFLSNRKAAARKGDDEGAVKEGIAELREGMARESSRTLGEYLSRLAPSVARIRKRWTARDMYEKEFDAIWSAQSAHHSEVLTEARRKELRRALFFQRPLWFDPKSVGRCELEPAHRRAPAYLLEAQRFRLLQTVNNLQVIPPGEPARPLTSGDRRKIVDALEFKRELTFKAVRKLLGLTGEYAFNLESGGEKKLRGNRTSADFHGALGERWFAMSADERDRLVEYVHAFQDPGKLARAADGKWGLGGEAAEGLAKISLEPEYLNLSRPAIKKFLPLLEAGLTYGEARRKLYPEAFGAGDPVPLLPPVNGALPEIRNPAVMRSLTELRKVVNAVIREYGRPEAIRVELARELKRSKKQRERISEANRRNERAGIVARREIIKQAGLPEPTPADVRKYLLAEECKWTCPYTGRAISPATLFGPEPQFDIEHIIPFSVSMDNSFQNLTLCYVLENRAVKGNRTPRQSYGADEARYQAVLDRVGGFAGDRRTVAAKLRRFLMDDQQLEEWLEDFRSRQLNDTSYACALAAHFLGKLYGGAVDADGYRRVQATSGQATAYFRSLWRLNSVLNDGPTTSGGHVPKSRDDHRHHAVDALVIGLTDAGMIKRLADAAQRAPAERRRRFASLQAPWNDFVDSVRGEIGRTTVSHRSSKKVGRAGRKATVRGALHEETIYSAPDSGGTCRVRRALAAISKGEIESIVDSRIRALVQAKLLEVGGDPKKFADEKNLPAIPSRSGARVPIRRVRVRKAVPTFRIGNGRQARHVASESNHHVEIVARTDARGRDVAWEGRVVSLAEAARRLKERRPVVERDCGAGMCFRFSLSPGEAVECDAKAGGRGIYVMRKVSQLSSGQLQIGFAPVNDARRAKEMQVARDWLWANPDTLRRRRPRKIHVGPLGELSEAHD